MQDIFSFLRIRLFQCKYFTITVREVMITIFFFLLLFFLLIGCQEDTAAGKETMIQKVCVFSSRNLSDLEELFDRADLCSQAWFVDYDAYIDRIKEQNSLLKHQTNNDQKEIYRVQVQLLEALEAFKEKPNESTISALEEAVNEYQKKQKEQCKGKEVME